MKNRFEGEINTLKQYFLITPITNLPGSIVNIHISNVILTICYPEDYPWVSPKYYVDDKELKEYIYIHSKKNETLFLRCNDLINNWSPAMKTKDILNEITLIFEEL